MILISITEPKPKRNYPKFTTFGEFLYPFSYGKKNTRYCLFVASYKPIKNVFETSNIYVGVVREFSLNENTF